MDLTSTLIVIVTWGVIFVIHEIYGCNGQDVIGPSPAIQAALRGDSPTLTCSRGTGVTSFVSWYDADPKLENPLQISFGGDIITGVVKYTDNFLIQSSNEDEFNLAISNIAVEDEGFYYCQLVASGESSQTVTLTVEVQSSSMSMTQDGNPVDSSNPVIVTVGETSAIVCTALGARPMVDILWFHLKNGESNKVEITTGMTQTNTSYPDGTSDTVSTLQYTPGYNEYDDGTIRCESTGQLVATPVSASATLSVQYMPIVTVQYGGDKAICSSYANPDVPLKGYADMEGYIFIVNNTDEYAPTECSNGQCTLSLEVKFNTDVRCNATNSIGTGFATTVAIPGAVITTTPEPTTPGRGTTIGGEVICNDTIYVAFLVILSLLLVASLVFNIVVVIRYNRLLHSGKTSDAQMESRKPNPTNQAAGGDQYQELNMKSREKEHAYQRPDSSGLLQRVENEQGPTYEDLNNSSHDNLPTYEVTGDEVKAGGNQQSPMYVNARPTRPRHGKHNK